MPKSGNITSTFNTEEIDNYKLITGANDYVVITDEEDKVVWINEGFTRLTGYSFKDVKGRKPSTLLRGVGTNREISHDIDIHAKKREPFRAQILNYTKTGEPIWLAITVTPFFKEDGSFEKFVTIGSDITAIKRHEEFVKNRSFQLNLINTLAKDLLQANSYLDTFEVAMQSIKNNFKYCSQVSATMFDFNTKRATFFAVESDAKTWIQHGLTIHIKDFDSIKHLKKLKHYVVDDISILETPSLTDHLLMKEGVVSYALIPLTNKGELIGSLNLGATRKFTFNEDVIETMQEVGNMLSLSLIQSKLSDELQVKNDQMESSLLYARRIQEAILPEKTAIRSALPNSFVLYQPKDVVSGDFYWFSDQGSRVYFAAADCTGHGVPGAFMSMICSSLLSQIVNEKGIIHPNKVLTQARNGIIKSLKQKGTEGEQKDGMDAALCMWDMRNGVLEFAGAHNSLYLVRKTGDGLVDLSTNKCFIPCATNGEYNLFEISGDRQPVGYYYKENLPFTAHRFELEKEDTIYITTDGFSDQFGGNEGRKYMPYRFKELLLEIQGKSMRQQRNLLLKAHEKWKGKRNQIDDILVMGVKF